MLGHPQNISISAFDIVHSEYKERILCLDTVESRLELNALFLSFVKEISKSLVLFVFVVVNVVF